MKKVLFTLIAATGLHSLQAQTNLGFETWTSADPSGWTTLNAVTSIGGPATTLQETAMPAVGAKSAKMIVATCIPCGGLGLPNPLPGITIQTIPYTARPATLTFKWKGTVTTGDTALVGAGLSLMGSDIGGAEFLITTSMSSSSWQTQTITFSYGSSSAPDTMQFGGVTDQWMVKGYSGSASTTTDLYIDDFIFAGGTVGVDLLETDNNLILAYPNPANTVINLNLLGTDATNLQVLDISGKVVYTENNILAKHVLNVENYNSGSYIIKFFDNTNTYVGTARFNVVK